MSKEGSKQVAGRWLAGPDAGRAAVVSDIRAGLVYGIRPDGTRVFGSPDDFQARSGESGERLLSMLLPPPLASSFYTGTIRESLAAVHSTAVFGRQDTRSWEDSRTYIVDDGEGNAAIAQFAANDVVGVMCSHDPIRSFEARAEAAPEAQRARLASLLSLPFLQSASSPVTAIFWTEDGRLSGPEPWFRTYLFGGEIFRRELLDEETWRREGAEHHDLDATTVSAIIHISKRASPAQRIMLTVDELELVLPRAAEHHGEALDQLLGGGMFVAPRK